MSSHGGGLSSPSALVLNILTVLTLFEHCFVLVFLYYKMNETL